MIFEVWLNCTLIITKSSLSTFLHPSDADHDVHPSFFCTVNKKHILNCAYQHRILLIPVELIKLRKYILHTQTLVRRIINFNLYTEFFISFPSHAFSQINDIVSINSNDQVWGPANLHPAVVTNMLLQQHHQLRGQLLPLLAHFQASIRRK